MEHYTQILQQRRLSLQVSIEAVSQQTGIPANIIQALEANELSHFQSSEQIVAYTKAYCAAIGVNYQLIEQQVHANLYLYQRSQQARPTKVIKPSKKSRFKIKSPRILLGAIVIVILLGLTLINSVLGYIQKQRAQSVQAQQQAALAEKEKQTEALAKQKKASEKKVEMTITDQGDDVWQIANVIETDQSLEISLSLPRESTVQLYVDDVLKEGSFVQTYQDNFTAKLKIKKKQTIRLEVGDFANNEVKINGKVLDYDVNHFATGSSGYWTFEIVKNS